MKRVSSNAPVFALYPSKIERPPRTCKSVAKTSRNLGAGTPLTAICETKNSNFVI